MSRPDVSCSISLVSWGEAHEALAAVRRAVFIFEQHVPESLEWDADDAVSLHALASTVAGEPIGAARLLPDGHIGRMSVLKEWRGKGVGGLLLQALLEQARLRRHTRARLNAQTDAAGFYRRYGFEVEGPEFMEAGIAHVPMQRDLLSAPG